MLLEFAQTGVGDKSRVVVVWWVGGAIAGQSRFVEAVELVVRKFEFERGQQNKPLAVG